MGLTATWICLDRGLEIGNRIGVLSGLKMSRPRFQSATRPRVRRFLPACHRCQYEHYGDKSDKSDKQEGFPHPILRFEAWAPTQ
jgi:hypothetical protein